MIIRQYSMKVFFGLGILMCILSTCSPDLSDEGIAIATFGDMRVRPSLPSYSGLNTKGYVYLPEGIRGIILVKLSDTQYRAYERNCTFRPQEPSSTVEVHSSNLYIVDPVCGSQFRLSDGEPMSAPASRRLRRYSATYDGVEILITDDIE